MHRKSVGKTVLITGASTGIGAELAKRFAEGGFDLILVARNRDKLEQLAEEAGRRFGVSVRVVVKDLSEPAACGELIRELEEAGIEVHVLVNNAGIGVYGPFAETDWEREREMIRLNIEDAHPVDQGVVSPACSGGGRGKFSMWPPPPRFSRAL